MTAPRATCRLQFHRGFPFSAALPILPYLAELGISHVYASPILTAKAGSTHGYDVVDPTRINPELGGEEGFCALAAAIRAAGLGLVVDIVPNHMAVGGDDNAWWLDVLEHGPGSAYAGFFDIDWHHPDPALTGKVLLPSLGKPYGEALEAGEIALAREGGRIVARYFHHLFPIRPDDQERAAALGERPGPAALHDLLENQHYRLAWWRTAGDEINWRRFFDINELAGLRVEDEEVFERTHEKILLLYARGLIDGLRVDHVDGLSDPGGYCRRLRDALRQAAPGRPAAYLVVEKILGAGEDLRPDWACDGTSGYDFMNEANALLHDGGAQGELEALWARLSGRPAAFEPEELAARHEMLARSFTAQLDAAVAALHALAAADLRTRDVTHPAIRRSLTGLLSHFSVYRTYASPAGRPAADEPFFDEALARAKKSGLPADRDVLDQVGRWLGGAPAAPAVADLQARAITRFQQLSAPIAAKSVEDTAFYRYGRLLSRNDVGFDATRLGMEPAEFHRRMEARARRWPAAMLASATHDHKRGEDLRARLAVLSEMPEEWARLLARWTGEARALAPGGRPAEGDIAILLQMVLGAWPLDLDRGDGRGRRALAERLAGWQEKALREAKLYTDWSVPDEGYEAAARDLLFAVLAQDEAPALLEAIAELVARIAPAGAANGLAQTLLKLTVPGVPDFYQGTEFWDFSLVDPDNRRPVDYAARLAARPFGEAAALAAGWRDGRVKQALIAAALALRKERPALFAEGDYRPVEVTGPAAARIVAFARVKGPESVIAVAARLPLGLLAGDGSLSPAPDTLAGTVLRLPPGVAPPSRNLLDAAARPDGGAALPAASLLRRLPVALLA